MQTHKKNFLIIFGANSLLFKEILLHINLKKFNLIFISRSNPKIEFSIKFHFIKWQMGKKINLNALKIIKNKNIFLLNFIHDWSETNINVHINNHCQFIRIIQQLEIELKKSFFKIFISSLSSLNNPSNIYGKIKNQLNKLYYANNYLIFNIGLITGSLKFSIYKKIHESAKNKILFLPKTNTPLQIIHIKKISTTLEYLLKNEIFIKKKSLNISSYKHYSLEQLINLFNKNKKIIIKINLDIILLIYFVLYKLGIIKFQNYDSLCGLKRRYCAIPKFK